MSFKHCGLILGGIFTVAVASGAGLSSPLLSTSPGRSASAPTSTPKASVPITPASSATPSTSVSSIPEKTDSNTANEKSVDLVARWLGIGGLIFTVLNFSFGLWKTRRDRRLSIVDDFWFRKIITPTTIEPLLKSIAALIEGLPDRASTEDELRAYALKVTSEFQKLNGSVQPLALFHETLPASMDEKLRKCEDTLTEYASQLTQPVGPAEKTKAETGHTVWSQVNDAMRVIRDRQMKS